MDRGTGKAEMMVTNKEVDKKIVSFLQVVKYPTMNTDWINNIEIEHLIIIGLLLVKKQIRFETLVEQFKTLMQQFPAPNPKAQEACVEMWEDVFNDN